MTINTLHICNLDEVTNLRIFWLMVSEQDEIIFYADSISNKLYQSLQQQQPLIKKHYQSKKEQNIFSNLRMPMWLQLVNNANKTMTWK